MHVAQVAKHSLVFVAHAPCEVRVIQMLIPRRLWHVLQNVQAALDRVPTRRGQLFPRRKHVVADVILLLRRQLGPDAQAIPHFLLLLRWKLPEAPFVLLKFLPLLGREIAHAVARIRRPVGIEMRLPRRIACRIAGAIPSDHAHRFGLPAG